MNRINYREEFEDDIRNYLIQLDKNKPVIYCGDLNVARTPLDLKNAKLSYTSTMLSELQNIISFFDATRRIDPEKFSDYEKETFDLMKSLINIEPGEDG